MKDIAHKSLLREHSDEIIVSSANDELRTTTTALRPHRKVEALRIEPVVEFHRSSSGRNLRLKHISTTSTASLLASPQRLTPHAPDRKRSNLRSPPLASPSIQEKSQVVFENTETQSCSSPTNNQQPSTRKPMRSKSTDRRSSFSISAHVLQELGFTRSKTPELEQIGQNQRLDEAPGQESPVPSPLQQDQIIVEPSFSKPQNSYKQQQPVQQEEDRPMYQFDLWKRAAKTQSLSDAITVPKNIPIPTSPTKGRSSGLRRGSYEVERFRSMRMEGNKDSSESLHPSSLHRSFSTDGVPISNRAHMSRSASDPSHELEELSLTRSTSPTIGGRSSRPSTPPTTTSFPYHVEVDMDVIRWRKVELIGEGTFGKVYKTFHAETGEFCALKEIELRSSANSLQLKQVQKLGEEISVMRNLSHSHIVRYRGSYRTNHHFCIVMEYVPGGSIASMLKQSGAFREELIRKFTLQIVRGVIYLHRMGIIHRDIKGANVLINDQGILKLADFGCSKQLPQLITTSLEESLRSIRGSIPWMAPEVVRQTGHGFKADIWSIGATVIEMATGTHPWPSSTNSLAAMYAIATATTSPPLPPGLSQDARSFLQRCFCIDPEERASAAELEQHAFLRY